MHLFQTLMLTLFIVCPLMAQDRITGRQFATRSEVIARNGMAATSQPLATNVALDILKSGGNAVDAAIAANAVLGLMEPTGNGIGGDLFAVVWNNKERKLYGLNASGKSPKSLTFKALKAALGESKKIPPRGPLPVSVPGCVDGWFELHNKFGSLPMKSILQPAIQYSRDGFPVSELIAHYWNLSAKVLSPVIRAFRKTFLINGRAPRKGEIFKNSALANTLEKIAEEGRDAFYQGDIARKIDSFMKQHGGFLSFDDLASHESEWVDPISIDYRGFEVWELPPNGQGITLCRFLASSMI